VQSQGRRCTSGTEWVLGIPLYGSVERLTEMWDLSTPPPGRPYWVLNGSIRVRLVLAWGLGLSRYTVDIINCLRVPASYTGGYGTMPGMRLLHTAIGSSVPH
jgi:hypothetical protein